MLACVEPALTPSQTTQCLALAPLLPGCDRLVMIVELARGVGDPRLTSAQIRQIVEAVPSLQNEAVQVEAASTSRLKNKKKKKKKSAHSGNKKCVIS